MDKETYERLEYMKTIELMIGRKLNKTETKKADEFYKVDAKGTSGSIQAFCRWVKSLFNEQEL